MDIAEYKWLVRERLESGHASDAEWDEVTNAVLRASEDGFGTDAIDAAVGLEVETDDV